VQVSWGGEPDPIRTPFLITLSCKRLGPHKIATPQLGIEPKGALPSVLPGKGFSATLDLWSLGFKHFFFTMAFKIIMVVTIISQEYFV